jgi:hypothetical protein
VVLTHKNVLATVAALQTFVREAGLDICDQDCTLSYLTLAHILGRALEEFALSMGASIGYWQVGLLALAVAATGTSRRHGLGGPFRVRAAFMSPEIARTQPDWALSITYSPASIENLPGNCTRAAESKCCGLDVRGLGAPAIEALRPSGIAAAAQGDVKKLTEDITALKPTLFVAVPRVLERIQSGILAKLKAKPWIVRALVDMAYRWKLSKVKAGVPLNRVRPQRSPLQPLETKASFRQALS